MKVLCRKNIFRSVLVLFGMVALTSCFEKSGVLSKLTNSAAIIKNPQENCLAPDAAEVKNIGQRLAASSVEVGSDFCGKSENYECYVRKFSPTIANNVATVEECVNIVDLGGDVCMKLRSQSYNTKEASRAPGASTASSQTGAEFNRSEYVCHHRDLNDGDAFLAVGESESLKDALSAAFGKCTGIAPRLSAGK